MSAPAPRRCLRGRLLAMAALVAVQPWRLAALPAYEPSPGGCTVAVWRGDWHDASRDRTIPVKIYYPASRGDGPSPVIIFSHGLGGSREIYAYLGEYWAAHGYVSVHVQHPGSDEELLRRTPGLLRKLQALKAAADDPANLANRPADIRFAIDELTRLETDPAFPLHGRMDLDRLGIAGHSFGAYTVLAVAGEAVGPDEAVRYYGPDPRVKAAIAMSSDPALLTDLDAAYDRIRIPIFHMTGTKDQVGGGHNEPAGAVIGNATPAQRRVAFDHTRHAPAYLLTLKDGDHLVFAGVRRKWRGGGEHDAEYHRIICIASTAFWDATLRGNDAAKRWLEQGGFAALLGGAGTFEQRHPAALAAP